jgi:AmiR/NasT family two-component response regulator
LESVTLGFLHRIYRTAANPNPVVIVLNSHLDDRKQATSSSGVDALLIKNEKPDRVATYLEAAAESLF